MTSMFINSKGVLGLFLHLLKVYMGVLFLYLILQFTLMMAAELVSESSDLIVALTELEAQEEILNNKCRESFKSDKHYCQLTAGN